MPAEKGLSCRWYPFPQRIDGRFYFGYSEWSGELSERLVAWTSAMPRLLDLAIVAVLTACQVGYELLLVWLVAAAVDFSYNTLGIFRPPVDASLLLEMIERTFFAVSTDETRYEELERSRIELLVRHVSDPG